MPCKHGLGFVFILALALVGCASSQPPAASTSASPTTTSLYPPVNVQLSGSRFPILTASDMCNSALVADVTVAEVGISHWNTADGARPAGFLDNKIVVDKAYRIYTPLHFSQMHICVDHRHEPTSEFVTVGGKVGQDQVWIDELPQLTPRSRYLVVLFPTIDATGPQYTEKWLMITDAFPIDAQGIVLLHPESTEPGQETHPAVTEPLTKLAQELAGCK